LWFTYWKVKYYKSNFLNFDIAETMLYIFLKFVQFTLWLEDGAGNTTENS